LTIEEEKGFLTLKGLLKPMEVGEERDREIQVYLDWGLSQDTVTVKKNKDDHYPLVYELIKDQSWVSLSLDIGEKLRYNTTVFVNEALPDLQFFTESGRLVHGFGSKVAFKAIGLEGKGIEINGNVFDNQGNKVKALKAMHSVWACFFLWRIVLPIIRLKFPRQVLKIQ